MWIQSQSQKLFHGEACTAKEIAHLPPPIILGWRCSSFARLRGLSLLPHVQHLLPLILWQNLPLRSPFPSILLLLAAQRGFVS